MIYLFELIVMHKTKTIAAYNPIQKNVKLHSAKNVEIKSFLKSKTSKLMTMFLYSSYLVPELKRVDLFGHSVLFSFLQLILTFVWV